MRSVLTPLTAALALLFALTSTVIHASDEEATQGDAEAGQAKSAVCVSCHMADGNTLLAELPQYYWPATGLYRCATCCFQRRYAQR